MRSISLRKRHPQFDPHRQSRGQILVIFVVATVLFVLLCGVVLDIAYYWVGSLQAQRAADAAALAGAVYLPGDTTSAYSAARSAHPEWLHGRRHDDRDAGTGHDRSAAAQRRDQRTRGDILLAGRGHHVLACQREGEGHLRPARADGQSGCVLRRRQLQHQRDDNQDHQLHAGSGGGNASAACPGTRRSPPSDGSTTSSGSLVNSVTRTTPSTRRLGPISDQKWSSYGLQAGATPVPTRAHAGHRRHGGQGGDDAAAAACKPGRGPDLLEQRLNVQQCPDDHAAGDDDATGYSLGSQTDPTVWGNTPGASRFRQRQLPRPPDCHKGSGCGNLQLPARGVTVYSHTTTSTTTMNTTNGVNDATAGGVPDQPRRVGCGHHQGR